MEKELMQIRFGLSAVEMGFITADQLVEALKTQVMEDIKKKEHRLIGTILLDMGFITSDQIDKVVFKMMNKA
jgi:hypothetical protein